MNLLQAARTIILDANLLVLLLVGLVRKSLIGQHKRTRNYTVEDFDLLEAIVATKASIVVTPNILTEVSNLVSQIGEPVRSEVMLLLGRLCLRFDERYLESALVGQSTIFARLGLTDAGLVDLCGSGILLVTDDLNLYLHVNQSGGVAVNFNHIRQRAWS